MTKGELVAKVLAGSWRNSYAEALDISEAELDLVTPLLYDSGTAALGWSRIKNTTLRESPSAQVLHQAYRLQSLQSEVHEQKIFKVFRRLRESGIDAILAKGWATAGLYSARALRPYGDLDICVRPSQVSAAEAALQSSDTRDCWVDLHRHFSEIDERSVDDLFNRSRIVELNGEPIRVLGLEDQLALSCIHLLKHGGWRPLWLCDVGVTIESLPAKFNWDICLGRNATRASWIACAIALSHRLLGADTSNLPLRLHTPLPSWLVANILQQWESPFAIHQPPMSHPIPMADLLRHPSGLFKGLKQRWPNPILATISVNGRFNNLPRLPYQMANCLFRIAKLVIGPPNGVVQH